MVAPRYGLHCHVSPGGTDGRHWGTLTAERRTLGMVSQQTQTHKVYRNKFDENRSRRDILFFDWIGNRRPLMECAEFSLDVSESLQSKWKNATDSNSDKSPKRVFLINMRLFCETLHTEIFSGYQTTSVPRKSIHTVSLWTFSNWIFLDDMRMSLLLPRDRTWFLSKRSKDRYFSNFFIKFCTDFDEILSEFQNIRENYDRSW